MFSSILSKEPPAAQHWHSRWHAAFVGATAMVSAAICAPAAAQEQLPNILVIMADDLGTWTSAPITAG